MEDLAGFDQSRSGTTLVPGSFVLHPDQPDWGLGQVQSVDGMRVTVNFENAGKQLINGAVITLLPGNPDQDGGRK